VIGSPTANIQYNAAAGETNDLGVVLNSITNRYTFHESGTAPVTAGSACTQVDSQTATCPRAGITQVLITLGDGNDRIRIGASHGGGNVGSACCVVAGGDGNDTLDATFVTDVGVALNGEAGVDTLIGGAGPDLLRGGTEADTMTGGAGTDEVSYSDHTTPVTATLDGVRNDGTPVTDGLNLFTGTASDLIAADVENLSGGKGDDQLTGNNGANRMVGNLGHDDLSALGGRDEIFANDALHDKVGCGGGIDTAEVDLKDGPPGFPNCETVNQAAVDQHPTVEILGKSLRLDRARRGRHFTRVKLKCPGKLHRGCRGKLTVKKASNGRAIGDKRYRRIAAGATRRVRVPITPKGVLAVRRHHGHLRVRVKAREKDPRGDPKISLRTMRLKS
jgi:hypothetical protein